MSDERLRELERRAAQGDAEAEARLQRERDRIVPPYAVVSDVHANAAALEAVLADIAAQGIGEVVCLGDLVGYGPDPVECVERVRKRCRTVLCGNHDDAVIRGPVLFGQRAHEAIVWTQRAMRPRRGSSRAVRRRWKFLGGLPLRSTRGPDLFVHGSPRSPILEYVLPSEVEHFGQTEKYEEIFAGFERLLFVGHTHLPCVITDDYVVRRPADLGGEYTYPDQNEQKAIVNVGSVGQPRDRDPRACYVVVRDASVSWRRVAYDLEQTVRRIEATPELHDSYVRRLREGI